MCVHLVWGGFPSSVFTEVFVSSMGRFVGRLLCGTLIGAVVGLWLEVWGVGAVLPYCPRGSTYPFRGLSLCEQVLLLGGAALCFCILSVYIVGTVVYFVYCMVLVACVVVGCLSAASIKGVVATLPFLNLLACVGGTF